MIYELRIYTCAPGKLPLLQKRFETTTLALFERHGIKPVGFWTTYIGESNQQLFYILAWDNVAERDKRWTAFMHDPEWVAKKGATEVDGPLAANISSQLLSPTAFSALR